MSQKAGNHVKPPTQDGHEHTNDTHSDALENQTIKESLNEQHHGENSKSLQDDRKIGQNNGTGRPPLMKK